MKEKVIMGISLIKRRDTADKVQELLTVYGCYINTRLGLHQASGKFCSEDGLIILQFLEGAGEKARELEAALKSVSGVQVQMMIF